MGRQTMDQGRYVYSGRLCQEDRALEFVGRREWIEDSDGIIRSPTWRFYTGGPENEYFPNETDDRQRQDIVFLSDVSLTDFALSVKVMLFTQTTYSQIVFRAQDSRRYYAVVVRDVYEKDIYELTLWVQNEYGLRRRIGHALGGSTCLRTAAGQRPKWDTVHIEAQGTRLGVRLNDAQLIEVDDSTYAAGAVGLGSLGRTAFRDLMVNGITVSAKSAWKVVSGESPPYVYPYRSDTKNLSKPTRPRMSWPSGAVLDDGEILLLRTIGYETRDETPGTVIVRSTDNGKTWSEEEMVAGTLMYWPFEHRDGKLSALTSIPYDQKGRVIEEMDTAMYKAIDDGKMRITQEISLVYSNDRGRRWSKPVPLRVGEQRLSQHGAFWIYSGFRRLSDGSLLWTPYGGKSEHTVAEKRTNQTFALRSEDDGKNWSVPVPVEVTHLDTNEGAAAELANGDVLIFMRSVRSPFMWKSRSSDKGRTWGALEETPITLDCPQLLRHSGGLLVLQSRSGMVLISADDGETWGPVWNIGHCVHMGCLLETADGALLVAHLDAGFASITKVRATRMRIASGGVLPAEEWR